MNSDTTKYSNNISNISSAYLIMRMNKPNLICEPSIIIVNDYTTDIVLNFNESVLNTIGIILPTAASRYYSNIKVISALVSPVDDSISMMDMASDFDKQLLTATNKGALEGSKFINFTIKMSEFDSSTNMYNKLKKVSIKLRLYKC